MDETNSAKSLPFFYIGKEVTSLRKKNFESQKYPALCDELGKEDTKSIWYTREHIAKLLEEIDHANGNGIRVYFGTYEQGHPFEGQMCLVMNTTREKKSGDSVAHMDVILEEEPDFKQRSKRDRDAFNGPNRIKRDFNFGSPCPPRCDNG